MTDNADFEKNAKESYSRSILLNLFWVISSLIIINALFSWISDHQWEKQNRKICETAIAPIQTNPVEIYMLHTRTGSTPNSVRVDFNMLRGGVSSAHWITCFFSRSYDKKEYDLKAIETEDGFLAPQNVFFLNRYVLYKDDANGRLSRREFMD